jgi:hypothetical protein
MVESEKQAVCPECKQEWPQSEICDICGLCFNCCTAEGVRGRGCGDVEYEY